MQKPKSKLVAYLLWACLGFFAIHRFYIGAPALLRFFTLNFLTIGWCIDFFTLSGMVDKANALCIGVGQSQEQQQQQSQSIVVNVMGAPPAPAPAPEAPAPEEAETKE